MIWPEQPRASEPGLVCPQLHPLEKHQVTVRRQRPGPSRSGSSGTHRPAAELNPLRSFVTAKKPYPPNTPTRWVTGFYETWRRRKAAYDRQVKTQGLQETLRFQPAY